MSMLPPVSPIMAGLLDHRVAAKVKDLDHYRLFGGMAIETDYIISVKSYNGGKKSRPEPDFMEFTLSKTFNSFRMLADQLNDAADKVMSMKGSPELPRKVKMVANFCQAVLQLIDSQRTQYLGKVSTALFCRKCDVFSLSFWHVLMNALPCKTLLKGQLYVCKGLGKTTLQDTDRPAGCDLVQLSK